MSSVNQVLEDADRVVATWDANTAFTVGTITREEMHAKRDAVRQKARLVEEKKIELRGLTESLQDDTKELNLLNTRVKSGIRAYFGPDSPQVAQVGNTRTSDRKPRTRRAKPTTETP